MYHVLHPVSTLRTLGGVCGLPLRPNLTDIHSRTVIIIRVSGEVLQSFEQGTKSQGSYTELTVVCVCVCVIV